MDGYVKLHRTINDWEWKKEPLTLAVFVHLLTNASFKAHRWKGIELQPGQLLIGREHLSAETGVSQQCVRTALTRLKSTGSITSESTSEGTLVTIIKWDIYQSDADISTSELTNDLTSDQPAINQQLTSDQPLQKNVKNVKKERREEGIIDKCEKQSRSDFFHPPTIEEVTEYFREIKCQDDPNKFFDYYETNGWIAGKVKMRNWKSAARNWNRNSFSFAKTTRDPVKDRKPPTAKDGPQFREPKTPFDNPFEEYLHLGGTHHGTERNEPGQGAGSDGQ